MSADLLRRAATTLRERAAAATPGPWHEGLDTAGKNTYAALVADVPGEGRPTGGGWDFEAEYGGYLIGESLLAGDRAYIATVHPGVALALADWLDYLAPFVQHGGIYGSDGVEHAIAVARAILGEPS